MRGLKDLRQNSTSTETSTGRLRRIRGKVVEDELPKARSNLPHVIPVCTAELDAIEAFLVTHLNDLFS